MSSTLKELKNRINAAKNIQQITRAMKLIAAAKIRKLEAMSRTYKNYLSHIEEVKRIIGSFEEVPEALRNLLIPPNPKAPKTLVLFTADRGLCGAFNTNLIDLATQELEKLNYTEIEVLLYAIGRKADHFLSKLASRYPNLRLVGSVERVHDYPSLQLALRISSELINLFTKGETSEIRLVRPKFISVTKHLPAVDKFLPIGLESRTTSNKGFILCEPSPEEVLRELVEIYLRGEIYGALIDLKASEFGARLVAMTNATENAANLIKELMLQFFKKRQELITKELMDIVEAAEGLKEIS